MNTEEIAKLMRTYGVKNTQQGNINQKKYERADVGVSPKKKKDEDKVSSPGYLQKGALKDGYTAGSITKAILGTGMDASEDLLLGAVSGVEQSADALTYGAPMMEYGKFFQDGGIFTLDQLNAKEEAFRKNIALAADAVKKDSIDEKAVSKSILNAAINGIISAPNPDLPVAAQTDIAPRFDISQYDYEADSVLGDKLDSLVQSGGSMLARKAVAGVLPGMDTALLGLSAMGGEVEDALNKGADYSEAGVSGLISAGAEIVSEMFSDAIKLDGVALPDAATKQIGRLISNKTLRNLAAIGVDMAGEGAEEIFAGAVSAIGQKLTYASDKELKELFSKEDALDAFIGGALMGGVSGAVQAVQSGKSGVDYASGLTKNEKAVVDQLYNERVEEAKKNGEKVKKSDVYNDVLNQMEKGYITTDDIERILGGDTYTVYKDTPDNDANKQKYKDALSKRVSDMVKGDRLSESYAERGRRREAFQTDLTQYDAKAQATYKRAMESGVLNNTRRSHELVDLVAKIEADKGVPFDFTNNKKLKESGFAVEGATINGYVTSDGVVLNTQSTKYLNTVVGHEITHVLEGTEFYDTLQKAVFDYAQSKGELSTRWNAIKKLYKDADNTKINQELAADLVGDYIFSDAEFVNSLASGNRNIFEKIYDEVKYLCKTVTAGSKEARQLEKVKKIFADAYRQDVKNTAGDGVKFNLTKNPSNPNFTSEEWLVVNHKKHSEFDNPKYDLDETNKWLYSNKNGKTVFAIYSKNHPEDPTVLYGSRGKKAERDYVKLSEWQEGSKVNVNRNRAALDRLLSSIESQARNTGDGVYSSGGRRTTVGNEPLSFQERGSDGRGDSIDGPENLQSDRLTENDTGAADVPVAPVTFSNDYQTIRNFMKDDADIGPVKYSLSEENNNVNGVTLDDLTFEDIDNMSDEQLEQAIRDLGYDIALDIPDDIWLDEDLEIDDISEELEVEPEVVQILYRRKGLGDSYVADEKTAVMTAKRIDQRIAEHGAGMSDYARRYITRISPKDFIDMTVYEKNIDRNNFDTRVRGDFDGKMGDWNYEQQLKDSEEPPVLIVDISTGQIIGHNGRHRMRAMEMAGIESVEIEVELHDEDGYIIKYNSKTIPDLAISSQFDTAIETRLSNIIPFNKAHRNEILNSYGETAHTNAGIKYALSSTSAKPFDNGVALETPQLVKPPAENATEQTKTQPTVELTAKSIAPPIRNTGVKVTNKKRNPGTWFLEHVVDKGFTFEKLAKDSKNRELEAKWHNIRNATSAAQNMIGKGIEAKGIKSINQMRKAAAESGVSEFAKDYLGVLSVADKYSQSSNLSELIKANRYSVIARNFEKNHPGIKEVADNYFAYAGHLRTMLSESGYSEADVSKLFNALHSNAVIGDGSFETLARMTDKVYKAVAKNEFGKELRKTLGFPAKGEIAPIGENVARNYTADKITAPIRDVDEEVKKYIQDMMEQGQRLFDENVGDIQKKLSEDGKEELFHDYMYHKLNVDRSTMDSRFGKSNISVFPGVTAETSKRTVSKLESKHPEFAQYAQRLYEFENRRLDILAENGLVSEKKAAEFKQWYPHYVPIIRGNIFRDSIPHEIRGNRIVGESPVYSLEGSNKKMAPLFDAIFNRTVQMQAAITERSLGITESEVNTESGEPMDDSLGAVDPMEMDDVIDRLFSEKNLLKEGVGGGNPTLAVFENGERIEFDIADQMYDAMKPGGKEQSRGKKMLSKALKTPSSTFRKLVTEWNPTFWFTNPIKDIQDVLINSQHAAKTYANIPKAIAEQAGKGRYFQEYMEHVGNRQTYFDMEKGKFVEENAVIGAVKLPARKIAEINNAIELTPRLAEYIASREEGRSIDVSILDAARVTTNFAAGGDAAKTADSYFAPFLNASIQGAAQQVRNVVEANQQGAMGWAKLAAKYTLAGLPAVLLNDLIWDDDEDYEDLAEYIKNDYYIIGKYGDGKFVRIPKGRTVAAIQYAMKQMQNAMSGDDVADLATFTKYMFDNIGPNNPLTNNLIAPVIQVATNKAWYGEQLVPDRLMNVAEDQRFDESTDALSMKLYELLEESKLGDKLDIGPYQINYLLNQYGGGIADTLLPMSTPKAESGDDSFLGNLLAPLKDKFTTDSVLKNQNVSDFFDTEQALELIALEDNATMADRAKAAYMSGIGYETAALYQQKREIQLSDLPTKEKYEKARDIQKQINAMMENALESFNDVYTSGIYAEVDGHRFNYSEKDGKLYETKPLTADGAENWYYSNEQKSVERYGISYEEFWNNQDKYIGLNKYFDNRTEWDAKSKNFSTVAENVFGIDRFSQYAEALNGIYADKDSSGSSVSGSRLRKVKDYINGLNIPDIEKEILYKMEYPDYEKEYRGTEERNTKIANYIISREDLGYYQKKLTLEGLGFWLDENGYVKW